MAGPALPPVWHCPLEAHHPQAARCTQSVHAPLVLHGSDPQLVETQSQLAQVPLAGPAEVPDLHWLLLAHQPQPLRAVQSPHMPEVLQASVMVPPQLAVVYDHAVHVLALGPVALPSRQVELSPHQPQPFLAAQPPQLTSFWQPSMGMGMPPMLQALGVKSQSEQMPVAGPVELPLAQRPCEAHQPQPERAEHAAQSTLVAHISGAPGPTVVQALGTQAQPEQKPVRGPLEVPSSQSFFSAHHPQPLTAEQPPQVRLTLQGAGPVSGAPASRPVGVMPASRPGVAASGPPGIPTSGVIIMPPASRGLPASTAPASGMGAAQIEAESPQLVQAPVSGPIELPVRH